MDCKNVLIGWASAEIGRLQVEQSLFGQEPLGLKTSGLRNG